MIGSFEIQRQEDIRGAVEFIRAVGSAPAGTEESVLRIIDSVKRGGDTALVEMTNRFDGVVMKAGEIEIPDSERDRALAGLDEATRGALEKAAGRISEFARLSIPPDWIEEIDPGLEVGQTRRPFDTVGIYVPGGRYPYPSTVLMTGVPARQAGVKNILFCVPPGDDGKAHPATLAATRLLGECRVFRVGGAQAVAAMAFGTETIPMCQMIAGPGNVYVAAAKRLLSGIVKTDLDAGPSELAVLVDGSADVSFAVTDMLAQLEHDPMSVAVMVSDSEEVLTSASGVVSGLSAGGISTEGERGNIIMVLCASPRLAVDFLNELAPEHLELMTEDASSVVDEITSAGCVFIGPYSAAVMGDYIAGPSHVLPTGGNSRIKSGLSAIDFTRTMNLVSYTRAGFEADAPQALLLARLENLERHATSLDIRLRKKSE